MKCSVEGCSKEGQPFSGDDRYNLCPTHREAWRYYRKGYYEALGKEDDGYLHPQLWDKAMLEFLEWCRIEIVALTMITEAAIRIAKR